MGSKLAPSLLVMIEEFIRVLSRHGLGEEDHVTGNTSFNKQLLGWDLFF